MRVHRDQEETGKTNTSVESNTFSAELYRQYAPKMLAYLRKHLSSLDDAEDVLLEVFLAALEWEANLVDLPEDRQRAWLWTVARNQVTDYHRRGHRRQHVPLEQIAEIADGTRSPEQIVLRREEDEQLHHWIERRLSPLQQEVVTLRFTGELRCAEIALALNKREGTIRVLLSRALNVLRGMYGE